MSNLPLGTHDETSFGVGSTVSRGNVTSVTTGCSGRKFTGCVGGLNPATTYTYDETGQVLSMTDPCGNGTCSDVIGTNHTTTYSYLDSFTDTTPSHGTNAYLTQITLPPTNGVSHIEKFSYAYSDGQLTLSTDQNNRQTQFLYSDPLHRLSKTIYADNGQTTNCYADVGGSGCVQSGPPFQVVTTKLASPSPDQISRTVIDGLGHVTQTQQTFNAPSGINYVDTTYDGLGRVHSVSNPHLSTASSTDGTTTYAYDALGRVKSVTDPDGSAVTTLYSGNTTTVTDEAGKTRKSQVDGFGRLTDVWEDLAGLNYHTVYGYDGLNNLNAVIQNGSHNRTFVYDSLSRLTSATNPESGTTCYAALKTRRPPGWSRRDRTSNAQEGSFALSYPLSQGSTNGSDFSSPDCNLTCIHRVRKRLLGILIAYQSVGPGDAPSESLYADDL